MEGASSHSFSLSRITKVLRPVLLLGGFLYFMLFTMAGSAVIRYGSLQWRADLLLPFEVGLWSVLGMTMLLIAVEEIRKL